MGVLGAGVDLDPVLDRLLRAQFIVRDTNRWSGDYGQYRFAHAVVPQVAYGMLSRRDRRTAHLRVVDLLERGGDPAGAWASVVAEHLARAAAAVPNAPDVPELRSRAVAHLTRAADRAEALGSLKDSVAHLVAALALADDPLVAARLDLQRGRILVRGLSPMAAREVLEPLPAVFDAAGDDVAAGSAAGALGLALFDLGRVDEVRAVVEPRWEALKDRPDADDAVFELASAMGITAPPGEAREYAEAMIRVGVRGGGDRILARGLNQLGFYYDAIGLPRIARMFYTERLGLDNDPRSRMIGLLNLAGSWMPDDLARALDHSTQALEVVHRLALDPVPEILASNLALVQLSSGAWDAALAMAGERSGVERPVDAVALDLVTTAIRLARGEPVGPPAWRPDDLPEEGPWHSALGLAGEALRHGGATDVAEAAGALVRLGEARVADDLSAVWPWLFTAARESADRDTLDVLARLAGQEPFAGRLAFRAHRAWAEGVLAAGRGDVDTAIARMGAAVGKYEAWGSLPGVALARADLGLALLDSGDPAWAAEGQPALDAARAGFAALGARAWLERLDARRRGGRTVGGVGALPG